MTKPEAFKKVTQSRIKSSKFSLLSPFKSRKESIKVGLDEEKVSGYA